MSAIDKLLAETDEKMNKAIEAAERELTGLRTGRASTALVESVKVEAYGTESPINQVASISTPDASTILIQPWDQGIVKSVEKALLAANLGMTPSNDGRVIRLNIPALTQDRRKEIVKKAHDIAEHARVSVRNVRRLANEEIKKDEKKHAMSEDDSRRFQETIQKKTDAHVKSIDELLAKKEKEIMQV